MKPVSRLCSPDRTYDANGNTLSDASGKTYTWDFEDRMTSAVGPGVGTVIFKYDPFGRRIQKSSPLGTTNYLYDGQDASANIIEEVDSSGNLVARYAQGPGIDRPLAEFNSGRSRDTRRAMLSTILWLN